MRSDPVAELVQQGSRTERRVPGLGVSPGIAIGPTHITEGGDIPVRESHLAETEIELERGRFAEAVGVSLRQLRKLKVKSSGLPESAAEEVGYLLDAHLAMLSNSRLVRGVDHRIARARINAERAVQLEIDEIAKGFAAMHDAYLAARIEDIRVVGTRLIRNLIKKPYVTYSAIKEGAVILADELTPADTALIDPQRVAGFATVFGGAESHTAIVARALGLPAVLAVPGLLDHARAGDPVVIDGSEGTVIIDPCAATIAEYEARRDAFERERRNLGRLRKLPAVTRDGVEITLEANLELPVELSNALASGAMGLGLVRSEFLYMNRDDLPGEDEQYAVFSALVRGMEGQPVTVRTFDLGGEKIARSLSERVEEAANPALGLRAIRLSLQHRRLLDPQLAAMLRAASDGPLRILLPMISAAGEMRQVREALEQVARRLRRRGVRLPNALPPLGAMIEVPAAALRRRRVGGGGRFLCDRHQRPRAIHAGDRPQ
jgi:phosphotransferase system enzyme I (PtsI)